MTVVSPEYVLARKVLLDALAALKPQIDSVILVGAQAVYHHTGMVEGTGDFMTTDGDLALNTDLLAADPELTTALSDAGFTPGKNPGQWLGEREVRVDLMVVPHQSGRSNTSRRSARLPPHENHLARITSGLEPALVDNEIYKIEALDEADGRTANLRIAGPAALLAAKLTKIRERQEQAAAGAKADRLVQKDAVDSYRLLLTVETADLVAGFESHRSSPEALAVSQEAIAYLVAQRAAGAIGHVRTMLAAELPGDEVLLAQFDALADDLIEGLEAGGFLGNAT